MRKKSISSLEDSGVVGVDLDRTDSKKFVAGVLLPWPKIFLGIALVATIAGALFSTKTLAGVEKNIAEAKEAARPANVNLTKITTVACKDCTSIDEAVATFKKQNISVGEEKTVDYDSPDGVALIEQLGITRVPTYVVTGEISKNSLDGFVKANGEINKNTFIFTKVSPIFIDPGTKKEVGRLVATLLTDPQCALCVSPSATIEAYKTAGVKIMDTKQVVWNSAEGQRIIAQYKITKVPTVILSAEADYYDSIKADWVNIGTVEQDKMYVARNLFLPYRDLEKGQVLGLVDSIYLTDVSCSDCYKPESLQKSILAQGYGIAFRSERTIDVNSSEGKKLVSQYKITKIPTVLLSPEVDQYVNLKSVWGSVGTVEAGWYVFREMEQIGGVVYKDLTSNQVIRPTEPQAGQQP